MVKTITHTRLSLIFLLLFGTMSVNGQEVITGIVVDSATLSELPSVNVQIKNGTRGTSTDGNGAFNIQASRQDTLVFSLVGYETLELPLHGYEAGMVRLSEKYTMLKAITIDEYRRQDLYDGMFDEQNAERKRSIPFYFSKARKEKIKVEILKEENLRVQTYVDVVVNNSELKLGLMKRHSLTEKEYYDILRDFNERHYQVMYYLTRAELISLLNTFFDSQAARR
jgi:hypothetical protein